MATIGDELVVELDLTDDPQVVDEAVTDSSTASTSHTVDVPPHDAGELLLLIAVADGAVTITPGDYQGQPWVAPAGDGAVVSSGFGNQTIYSLVAATAETGVTTFTCTLDAAEPLAALVLAVDQAHGDVATAHATNTDDPPPLTPAWGAARTLWLATFSEDDDALTVADAPAGFVGPLVAETTGLGVDGAGVLVAWRPERTDTLDPAAWLGLSDVTGGVATIAVRPTAETWADITSFVRDDPPVRIARGRRPGADASTPARLAVTLDNSDGRFSPANPESPYAAALDRAAAVRVDTWDLVRTFVGRFQVNRTHWRESGADATVTIEAAGPLRRLAQDRTTPPSPIRRHLLGITDADAPVAYWPLEDDRDEVARYASALPAVAGMKAFRPLPDAASFDGFAASKPVPTFGDGGWLRGIIPAHPVNNTAQVRWLMAIPTGGVGIDALVVELWATGSATRWQLRQTGSDDFRVFAFDGQPSEILNSGSLAVTASGRLLYCRLLVEPSILDPADAFWELECHDLGDGSTTTHSGFLTGHSVGRASEVRIGADDGGQTLDGAAFGHVHVLPTNRPLSDDTTAVAGHPGEDAFTRATRVAGDAGETILVEGTAAGSMAMGPERPGTLLDVLREVERTDGGLLDDAQAVEGLVYRTREALAGQTERPTLDYDLRQFHGAAPAAVADFEAVRNDVTVEDVSGSAARAVATGALAPQRIGRYAGDVAVNLHQTLRVAELATWRLSLGAVDAPRYPRVRVDLRSDNVSDTLARDLITLAPGDLLELANLRDATRPWAPPDDPLLMVMRITEEISTARHSIEFDAVPYTPWAAHDRAADAATAGPRRGLAADATVLTPIDGADTTVTVDLGAGPALTTAAGDLPLDLDVAGEQVTVTAADPPFGRTQQLTITRGVNGVTAAHDAGAPVALWTPRARTL